MKIQAVVYRESTQWRKQSDLNSKIFNSSDADIILFPGWSFHDTSQVETFQKNANNSKTLGFLELKSLDSRGLTNALFCISKGQLQFVSLQLFATSSEIKNNHVLGHLFVKQFSTTRTFKIKNKVIRILQCGELNILRNEQTNGNKVAFRFLDKTLKNEFYACLRDSSLILNPQHTPMGNQGKMSRRRQFLSSNQRGYISTSNINSNQDFEKVKSAHYAYFDGQELERNVIDKGEFHRVYEYDIK